MHIVSSSVLRDLAARLLHLLLGSVFRLQTKSNPWREDFGAITGHFRERAFLFGWGSFNGGQVLVRVTVENSSQRVKLGSIWSNNDSNILLLYMHYFSHKMYSQKQLLVVYCLAVKWESSAPAGGRSSFVILQLNRVHCKILVTENILCEQIGIDTVLKLMMLLDKLIHKNYTKNVLHFM